MAKPLSKFELLQKEWYQILKEDGFADIEANEYQLKSYSTKFARPEAINNKQSKEDYYHMCRVFLNEYKFESRREQNIWAYHTEGVSARDIAQILNKVSKKKTSKTPVWMIINRLETKMKQLYLIGGYDGL